MANNVNEYACGCKEPTAEKGQYYDHACATCYRHMNAPVFDDVEEFIKANDY